MNWLVTAASRLPYPIRNRIQRSRWRIQALGLPRLRWWKKARVLRAYGVSIRESRGPALRYAFLDAELENFTYELGNRAELAEFVAGALGTTSMEIEGYFRETEEDPELKEGLRNRLKHRKDRKQTPLFGRRLGWYAIARVLKPSVIVETGIHDGLGSVLLLRALDRNAEAGNPGQLISIDINPRSGWLVADRLRGHWKPIIGSTFDVLENAVAGLAVGMIVHDSHHTYECELFEFTTALAHAAPTLALVSDNAHATSALRDVCDDLGIEYRFFKEQPKRHFYPGAGIGLGVVRRGAEPTNATFA